MRFSLRKSLYVICCVAIVGFGPTIQAQQTNLTTPQIVTEAADAQLRTGIEFEQNQLWLEAIQHYEAATRKFPDHAELKRRLLISRLPLRRSTPMLGCHYA